MVDVLQKRFNITNQVSAIKRIVGVINMISVIWPPNVIPHKPNQTEQLFDYWNVFFSWVLFVLCNVT